MDKYTIKHTAIALDLLASNFARLAGEIREYGNDIKKEYELEEALKTIESNYDILNDIIGDVASIGKPLFSSRLKMKK